MRRNGNKGKGLAAEDLSDLERLAAGVAAYFVAAHRFERSGLAEDFAWVARLESLLFDAVQTILRVEDMDRPSHVSEWSRNLSGRVPGEEG